MANPDREARLEALRERVREQLEPEQELTVEEVEVQHASVPHSKPKSLKELSEWSKELDEDVVDGLRQFASVLIFLGSALGILSGLLLLQGNPVDLLSTDLLSSERTVDLRMQALEAESGSSLEGLLVEWVDMDSEAVLLTATTDAYGWFLLEDVVTEAHLLRISGEGYITMEIELVPKAAGMPPVTMTPGSGVERSVLDGGDDLWTLDDAVRLSTAIGALTIASGAIGLLAGIEVRRATHYRRTQYLSGLALFSRGLIVFGPALILLGMIVTSFARDQFEDAAE